MLFKLCISVLVKIYCVSYSMFSCLAMVFTMDIADSDFLLSYRKLFLIKCVRKLRLLTGKLCSLLRLFDYRSFLLGQKVFFAAYCYFACVVITRVYFFTLFLCVPVEFEPFFSQLNLCRGEVKSCVES